ncbi:MAG: cell division protein FtsL [Marinobacterium sp.]|nr:cell division protein FtsL [Marinobacterium sp.]
MRVQLVELYQRMLAQGSVLADAVRARLAGLPVPTRRPLSDVDVTDDSAAEATERGGATRLRGRWCDRHREIADMQTPSPGKDDAASSPAERTLSSDPSPELLAQQSAEHLTLEVYQPVEIIPLRQLRLKLMLMAVLVVAIIISCVAVIFSAYENRRLFDEHQKLVQQHDDLQAEWGQLLLEQSAWAATARIERTAREKLEMQAPAPEQIEMVQRGN